MITGYNTDVRHGELVVHVQTEDKGREKAVIESVLYVGGRVVATKRSTYSEVLAEGGGDPDPFPVIIRIPVAWADTPEGQLSNVSESLSLHGVSFRVDHDVLIPSEWPWQT